jgi:hypothetical protein
VGLDVTLLAPTSFAVAFRFLVNKNSVHPCLSCVPSAGKLSYNFSMWLIWLLVSKFLRSGNV